MNRRPGLQGLKRIQDSKKNFKDVGNKIEATQIEQMRVQLESFRGSLEKFALLHQSEINRNPVFRSQFTQMCKQVGIDPLLSNRGFWSSVLGVGNFYYSLAVQIIDVCISTRPRNGGIIALPHLLLLLNKLRGPNATQLSQDDLTYSVGKLSGLGSGFKLITVGNTHMLLSLPTELNTDHQQVLQLAMSSGSGSVRSSQIMDQLKWTKHRVDEVLRLMLHEGMVWVDDGESKESELLGADSTKNISSRRYCFPSLFYSKPNANS